MNNQLKNKSIIKMTFLHILICFFLQINLMAASFTWSTTQVQEAIKNNVAVIDIRRLDEFARYGIIPSSHKLTFFDAKGQYDVEKWMQEFSKIVKDKKTPFVLVCAHANRTKVVARYLVKLGYVNTHELEGGINYGWLDKGLKTTKNNH